MHHHRINFDKYHPGYFGKVGMRNFHLNRNLKFCPTLNLDKLWSLVSDENRKRAQKEADKIPVVDIVQFVSIIFFYRSFQSFCFTMMIFLVRAVRMQTVYNIFANSHVDRTFLINSFHKILKLSTLWIWLTNKVVSQNFRDTTNCLATDICPNSQSLSRPSISQRKLKRRSKLLEALAFWERKSSLFRTFPFWTIYSVSFLYTQMRRIFQNKKIQKTFFCVFIEVGGSCYNFFFAKT